MLRAFELAPAEQRRDMARRADRRNDGVTEHVREADLVVIEATFLERDAAMALGYGHLTAAKRPSSLRPPA